MDIFLAISIFVATSALGFLGLRVTLHPAYTENAKLRYKFAFGILTGIACALILWQTILARHEQGLLHAQLDKIQKNTEQPPTVNVVPQITIPNTKQRAYLGLESVSLLFMAPTEISMSAMCKNFGQIAAADVTCTSTLLTGQIRRADFNKVDQELWFKVLSDAVKKNPPKRVAVLVPGDAAFSNQKFNTYSADIVKDIDVGNKTLLFVSIIQFRDEAGSHQVEVCQWLESPVPDYSPREGKLRVPPFPLPPDTWHRCNVHNGTKF
jgi:hypothetical protein